MFYFYQNPSSRLYRVLENIYPLIWLKYLSRVAVWEEHRLSIGKTSITAPETIICKAPIWCIHIFLALWSENTSGNIAIFQGFYAHIWAFYSYFGGISYTNQAPENHTSFSARNDVEIDVKTSFWRFAQKIPVVI